MSDVNYLKNRAEELEQQALAAAELAADFRRKAAKAREEEEAAKPKVLEKFQATVNAYGTFTIMAYDMYDADERCSELTRQQILNKVTWSDIRVNDGEYPEPC